MEKKVQKKVKILCVAGLIVGIVFTQSKFSDAKRILEGHDYLVETAGKSFVIERYALETGRDGMRLVYFSGENISFKGHYKAIYKIDKSVSVPKCLRLSESKIESHAFSR